MYLLKLAIDGAIIASDHQELHHFRSSEAGITSWGETKFCLMSRIAELDSLKHNVSKMISQIADSFDRDNG
jgi:hypothetical protein